MVGKKTMLVAAAIALIGILTFGGAALAGTMLTASLSGANEVPGPGDLDGSGTADLNLIPKKERICYTLTVENIEPATMAHIHKGASTEAGPILKGLKAPTEGDSQGCVRLARAKVMKIKNNPSGYYINVHNGDFPNGAVRGQLSK